MVVTEVRHLAHFWVSYGRCAMLGSPMGYLVGCPSDGYTKLLKKRTIEVLVLYILLGVSPCLEHP